MLSKEEFAKKYNKSLEEISNCGISWEELNKIYNDFGQKYEYLFNAGNMIAAMLQQIEEIHSVRVRVKDPEHLIEKIIRKKTENPDREITIENYGKNITDLIGVRALHLFKDEWIPIHEAIIDKWHLLEKPTANVREGDSTDAFKNKECEIVEHTHGYRSVHYLIESNPTKKPTIAEIQIRTIFEEGWSEIDHKLRYPYEMDNLVLSYNLAILNRLAGSADETATFVKLIKDEVKKYQDERDTYKTKLDEALTELESLKENDDEDDEKKEKIQSAIDKIDTIKKSNYSTNNFIEGNPTLFETAMSRTCRKCGSITVGGSNICPNCIMGSQKTCKRCGSISISGSNICPNCLMGSQKTCRKCGSITVGGSNICPNCIMGSQKTCRRCGSTSISGSNICPNCITGGLI